MPGRNVHRFARLLLRGPRSVGGTWKWIGTVSKETGSRPRARSNRIKQKWGQLTDDDITQVNGQRDQLEGKIQQRYGLAKDMARKDVDDWLKSQP
jgi:uncharacterized protein YjbJ (UPF0337 family)